MTHWPSRFVTNLKGFASAGPKAHIVMAEKECDRVHTNIKQCQCINRKLHPTPSSILPPYMQCKTYATHPPPHPWCQVVWANVRTRRIQQFFCGVRWLFGESVLCLSSFKSSHCIFSSHNLNLTFSKGSGITDLTDSNGICAFSAYYMYKIQFIIDCKYTHKPTDPIAHSTCHPMWTVTRILRHWTVSTALAMTYIVWSGF